MKEGARAKMEEWGREREREGVTFNPSYFSRWKPAKTKDF